MNHAGAHQQARFRGVRDRNPSSPSPKTPALGTPAPHTVKSNVLSVTARRLIAQSQEIALLVIMEDWLLEGGVGRLSLLPSSGLRAPARIIA